jgi:hypothetical protein
MAQHACEYRAFQKNFPVRLLGTWFEARNCISEPGDQEPYWEKTGPLTVST